MIDWTAADWLSASPAARRRWTEELTSRVGLAFSPRKAPPRQVSKQAFQLPEYLHRVSGTEWVLVPAGSFRMGLSEREEAAARALEDPPPLNLEEMRPVQDQSVRAFLAMKAPVTEATAERFGRIDSRRSRPEFGGSPSARPLYLTRKEVEVLATRLEVDLPTEVQWEWMCRGGTRTLFFFGDALPDDAELEQLVGPELRRTRPNPFGLSGLFVGEWCRDRFRKTYGQSRATRHFAVRGGGTAFWPWQGSEWSYCISAMRLPSSEVIDGMAAARFVVELDR